MAFSIRRASYYYTTLKSGGPGEAYRLLARLAELEVNLLAFAAVPFGPNRVQLTLFPEDEGRLEAASNKEHLSLDGPHPALLAQGDDELGALAGVHAKLHEATVDVYASTGVTDGRGSFGYIVYVRPEDADRAAAALGI